MAELANPILPSPPFDPAVERTPHGVADAGATQATRADGWAHRGSAWGPSALAAVLDGERERWFLWVPVGFGLGIAGYFLLPVEPRVAAVAALVAAALVLAQLAREGAVRMFAAAALVAASCGLLAAKLRSDWAAAPVLERQLTNVEVAGFVELVEPRPRRGQRITLRVVSLGALPADRRPVRVRIRTMAALDGLVPGDPIRLQATLAAPARPALPGDFDFARAAWFQRLGAIGYAVRRPVRADDLGAPPPALRAATSIARVRQSITERIRTALPGETGAIASALITGERGGISEATNEAYRASGLYHVLSISGLHMTIFAGAVFWLARLLLAAVPALALRQPIKKWAALLAGIAAIGYLLISGSQPATLRSAIMILIAFLAVMVDRPAIALRTVALSALVILALWPETLLDIGFQMSFAAVTALVAAYEELRRRQRAGVGGHGALMRVGLFLGGIVVSTVVAGLAVAPFSAYYFHQSQQYAALANVVAIPICNLVVMPAALAGLIAMPFGLEALPLWVMGMGIDAMSACARFVGAVPGALVAVAAMPTVAFLAMAGGGLWLCLWQTRWRLAGLVAVALGLALAPLATRPDLIIGPNGLVAARGTDGALAATRPRGTAFELRRWLEYDGDRRTPKQLAAADVFKCDAAGCVTTVRGRLLAVSNKPAAVADDCERAAILALRSNRPRTCERPLLVVDQAAVRAHGTHTVRFDGDRLVVDTVEARRGVRPWTRAARAPPPAGARGEDGDAAIVTARSGRLSRFASPHALGRATEPVRPEIEDDDEARSGDDD